MANGTTHDLVIRGATLVDGTGAPACVADVAVDGGTIVDVRRRGAAGLPGVARIEPSAAPRDEGPAGRGRRVFDSEGLRQTGGVVANQPNYDGAATGVGQLAPSAVAGV
ncbi:MAG: hypothetical protein ACK54X_07995, partial [Burkholderiales bacterium]